MVAGQSAAVFFSGMPSTAAGPVAETDTPTLMSAHAGAVMAADSASAHMVRRGRAWPVVVLENICIAPPDDGFDIEMRPLTTNARIEPARRDRYYKRAKSPSKYFIVVAAFRPRGAGCSRCAAQRQSARSCSRALAFITARPSARNPME